MCQINCEPARRQSEFHRIHGRPHLFGALRKAAAGFAVVAGCLIVTAPQASAQEPGFMASGDMVVTGFPGTRPPADGSGAIEKTFIDIEGASLRVFDVSAPGVPRAQLLEREPKYQAFAGEIGLVFGIALDDAPSPSIYTTATTAFGVNIVGPDLDGDGLPDRITIGQPDAQFMEGQFGTALGGGPGSVWRIDGVTGEISLFATIDSGGQPNSGAGLGNIAYDPSHYQLYVSDLDSGIITRLGMAGGVLGTFDHGAQGRPAAGLDPVIVDPANRMDITSPGFDADNPDTWGFADPQRRVWGLAYYRHRLYYAVEDGIQIWSVDIAPDGSFGGDARLEIESVPGGFPVSDILFTPRGRMVVAQRGGIQGSFDYSQFHSPKTNRVQRYRKDQTGNWVPEPEEYAIGFPVDHQNASGGVGLSCSAVLWSSGDALRDNPELADQLAAGGPAIVHGVQGNGLSLVRPRNVPPFSSYFVDYDGQFEDVEKAGHVGDVEVFRRCRERGDTWPGWSPGWIPPSGWLPPPWWPRTPDLDLWKLDSICERELGIVPSYLCTFTIVVTNVGAATFVGNLNVVDNVPGNVQYVPPADGSIPWNCGQPGGIGGPIDCISQNVETLLPGQSEILQLTIRRMPDFLGDTLINCALIDYPDDPVTGGWPGDPLGNNEDCGYAYPPGPDLEIRKTLDRCYSGFPDTICTFWLDIFNSGTEVYNGPLNIVELLPAGTHFNGLVSSSHPAWNCTAIIPGEVNCRLPAAIMFPGESHWVEIAIRIPADITGELENCVYLDEQRHPGDPDINGNNSMCVPFLPSRPVPIPVEADPICPRGWQPADTAPGDWERRRFGQAPNSILCARPPRQTLLCPKGWQRFPKANAVPRGWDQQRVGRGANSIICARPRRLVCDRGWERFPNANAVPRGWQQRRLGRGRNAIVCARPRPLVCDRGWERFPNTNAVPRGWQQRRLGRGRNAIICARPKPRPSCDRGWKQFPNASSVPRGWDQQRRGGIYCARPSRRPPPSCRSGWKQFPNANAVPKGWQQQRVRSGGVTIICAKRRQVSTPSCRKGWKPYRNRADIPRGWQSQRAGRGKSAIYCARPRSVVRCKRGQRLINGKCVGRRTPPQTEVTPRPTLPPPTRATPPPVKRNPTKQPPAVILRPRIPPIILKPTSCKDNYAMINGKCVYVIR
jgi:hypothetical protein